MAFIAVPLSFDRSGRREERNGRAGSRTEISGRVVMRRNLACAGNDGHVETPTAGRVNPAFRPPATTQPTALLLINLKVLRLDVPPSCLALADEVSISRKNQSI
jgi:hypothetical protein